ncbi:MAG: LssY C-terminal domain-containing protein [Thermodesulfobacteriota bacterium]
MTNNQPKTFLKQFLIPLLTVVMLSGCTPGWNPPVALEQVDFLTHAQTLSNGGIRVTAAIPGKKETELLFGTSLYNNKIQPVWLEIDNKSEGNYILIKAGIDRMRFSPLEASYQRHSGDTAERQAMDRFFHSTDFPNPVMAGTVTSGFIFTNLDEGHKAVNVDLVGDNDVKNFSFLIKIPGIVTDVSQVDLDSLYNDFVEITEEEELLTVLESFPCCTTNEDGDEQGDPLNIIFIGEPNNIFSALIRSGWHQTEITYGRSILKTIKSFFLGSSYRYSPISPLYALGRQQDIGLQKARRSVSLRNHMRLWRTKYNFQGKNVYLGQISRDIGVKFKWRTITTHVIDPNLDDTRNDLIGELAYSQNLVKIGFAKGSQLSTMADPHYNLTPDPYYSDGLRAVLFFDERPTALNQIEILNWQRSVIHLIKE